MNEVYYQEWYKRSYRWLRAPKNIHFVEFVATVTPDSKRLIVNVLDQPEALPRGSLKGVKDRYYFMDPLLGRVPIPAESFLFYLTLPRDKIRTEIRDHQNVWLPRFAKKRYMSVKSARGLEANVFEQEWGVRIIEGPNHWFFICTAVLFGIVCLVIGSLVGWSLREPYKGMGGASVVFGIGSYTWKLIYDLMKDMDEKVKLS